MILKFVLLKLIVDYLIYGQFFQQIVMATASTSKSEVFPKTLAEFGYGFNGKMWLFILDDYLNFFKHFYIFFSFLDEGKLRKIDPDTNLLGKDPYKFEVSKIASYNQKHYEALGEVITDHVYQMLINEGLHKIFVPSDSPEKEAAFVFCTKPDLTTATKLMILIHGSGVVRAGQWSRSLIINQSIDHGTQIPYIRRAKELGFDVLVTNGNENYRTSDDGTRTEIAGSESPEAHAFSVWQQIIVPAKNLESLVIVAHSYGGVVTTALAKRFSDHFKKIVFAVAFTDSVHSTGGLSDDLVAFLRTV